MNRSLFFSSQKTSFKDSFQLEMCIKAKKCKDDDETSFGEPKAEKKI